MYIYVHSTESYLKSPLKNSENTVDSNCFAAPYAYAIHDVKVGRTDTAGYNVRGMDSGHA